MQSRLTTYNTHTVRKGLRIYWGQIVVLPLFDLSGKIVIYRNYPVQKLKPKSIVSTRLYTNAPHISESFLKSSALSIE